MDLVKIRNSEEFKKHIASVRKKRLQVEFQIAKEKPNWKGKRYLTGFCELCNQTSKFEIQDKSENDQTPNYRESLKCEHCKNNNRSRFILCYLRKILPEIKSKPTVFMFEQVTNVFKYTKKNFNKINLIGSEFLGYDKTSGLIINNIRHEDAMQLSFEDGTIDVIVSNDVYEHIPNIQKALDEAYRVLKKNGVILISIPFSQNKNESTRRAVLENGKIKNILPEIYHGNPISKKGSLVFYDYGWDFLDYLSKAGFQGVHMLGYYSLYYGYLGNGLQFIFVARKE